MLDTLLREDYARLSARVAGHELRLPHRTVRLRPARFLADLRVDDELTLAEVFAAVRAVADPRDDVAAFERECRETLATIRLDLPAARPGLTYYDAVAARAGHPVYPTGRCRLGMSAAELREFAPEFQPRFALRWAEVPDPVLAGDLPGWWPGRLFPVHPLMLRRPDPPEVVPEPYLEVSPTLSVRTVAVDALTQLKMPLPTSTLGLRNTRSLKPGTLADGAKVQRILSGIAVAEGLPVLLADEQTYGHAHDENLGFLLRRMPVADSVPVAALVSVVPELTDDVAGFFDGYLRTLFAWNCALFTRHGIALESHQQNLSVTPDLRLVLKDNDGALFLAGDFDDPRMVGDREALARMFVTITLHLCAGALAFGLAGRGLLPLRTGLTLIRDRLDEFADPFLRARTLDAPRLPHKAMLTAGTLLDKARTGAADINKHYGPTGPNYLREIPCC
ncbi:MAG: IucA/IucC family protein [Streptosporangiaceae bacterium]